jgi:hypothetical protein
MNSAFETYALNDEGAKAQAEIAKIFDSFLNELFPYMGISGREVAIVQTKLEEASFFAKKAAAKIAVNQK